MDITKSKLAVVLSKLRVFNNAKLKLEQYPADSEVAATVLWNAYMQGDIKDKTIADLGAGTGILGIGALILGARKVYLVEKDEAALEILRENLTSYKRHEIISQDIIRFNKKTDTIVQNPPFGTKEKHTDRLFLEKAFSLTRVIYSFHKTATRDFIGKLAQKHNFAITQEHGFDFPLKKTYNHHKRDIHRIKVSCFRFQKKQ